MLWNRNDLLSPVPVPTLELWKGLVPVPDPVPAPAPVPVPVPDSDIFSTVFQQQIFLQNLAFSLLEAAYLPRKLASTVVFYFLLLYYILCWIRV